MKRSLTFIIPLLLTAGCSRQDVAHAPQSAPPATPVVQVETVASSPVTNLYRASGTVRSRDTAVIAPRIAADILEVRVHAGDHVQAGQILAVLDRRELQTSLSRAEAGRIEAEGAVAETEQAIASARASAELARVTHRRFEDLLAKRSVSQQEFDESYARLKSAEATLEMAGAKRRQVEARRKESEAEASAARVTLGYATLVAPFAGLVTERRADPGTLAVPGTPLLILEREGNLRLEVSVDESRLSLVRIGESVEVEMEGLDHRFMGSVGEIVPSVDPGTRSFTAKIDLPEMPELRTGMFGRAAFAAGKRDAVLIPQSAILERGQIQSVHVVEGDTARLRLVSVGETRGESREILSGLTPGERVVVVGPALLADGGRVAIQKAAK